MISRNTSIFKPIVSGFSSHNVGSCLSVSGRGHYAYHSTHNAAHGNVAGRGYALDVRRAAHGYNGTGDDGGPYMDGALSPEPRV